jgi:hypothetical protein
VTQPDPTLGPKRNQFGKLVPHRIHGNRRILSKAIPDPDRQGDIFRGNVDIQ